MILKKNGFTLVEMVITIGVFTVGIMGAFTLALSNLNVVKDNFNRVLASNLAREGLEIIRNTRDSNWLKIDSNVDCDDITNGLQLCDWDENLNNGANLFFLADYNNTTVTSLTPCGPSLDQCFNACSHSDCRLFINANGYYSHSTGEPTNFSRILRLQAICFNLATEEEIIRESCNVGTEKKIGLEVTSRVGWWKNNELKYVEIVDYLYNWRR